MILCSSIWVMTSLTETQNGQKMKQILMTGLVLLISPMVLFAVNMTFVVEKLKSNQGSIQVGIYADAGSFLKKGKTIAGYANKGRLTGEQAKVFCQLKPGTYAVAVFHDENGNGDLDTNFIGIPKEGYGFSNNPKSMMGPPEFKEAAFTVGEEDLEMLIQLKY